MAPQPAPAHPWLTRIQQVVFSSCFPLPVPVELDLHAAVLVRVDLFPPGSGDDGGLGAVNHGFRGLHGGPVGHVMGDTHKFVLIGKIRTWGSPSRARVNAGTG